jgi:hypothetical protein
MSLPANHTAFDALELVIRQTRFAPTKIQTSANLIVIIGFAAF